MLDIFNSDPFSTTSLTDAVNELSFVPGRIGEMGLFSVQRVATLTVAIEQKGDVLILIPPSPRGGPGETARKSKRTIRNLTIPHFQIDDAVMADEVQGVRQFGDETQLETVMMKVGERLSMHTNSHAATEEYARIGAVKGVITYEGGTTLNLFTEFGVNQLPAVDFDLDNASPGEGALRKKCTSVIRSISKQLGGVPWSGKARAMVGDNFFDDILAHPEVRETYKGWSQAQILREGYIEPNGKSYGAFEFGDIIFENYRGSVGGTNFVETDEAHIFPEGVSNLFRTAYAPADYVETVNTLGRRLYAKQIAMRNGKGIDLECQMNALQYCTRPKTLIKGTRS